MQQLVSLSSGCDGCSPFHFVPALSHPRTATSCALDEVDEVGCFSSDIAHPLIAFPVLSLEAFSMQSSGSSTQYFT